MNRRAEREQAFVLTFEKEFNADIPLEQIISSAAESGFIENDEFSEKLAITADEHVTEIDGIISGVTIGWDLSRISKAALAVLRIAVCEIEYFDEIPVSVSINEAVELGNKYASSEDAQFINGILGTVARSKEKK